ncbi:TPA: CXC chemokine-degrading serine protease SpyCEP [Streptococcus pyogenes]|nr:CXC chemokine-degrading serine protease SpyCEP [Streptococcus pyogenes]HEQ9036225.1 CXC chemokine-degrading serine protease SpyCEP [Streptococcus pyogenes]
MEKKQRFSLRKYKSGTFSVLVGSVFLMMTTTVAADELSTMSEPTITNHAQQQAQPLTNTELSSAESQSPDTSQVTPETNREKEQSQDLVSEPTTTELADTDSAPMANTGPDATQKSASLPPVNTDVHDWVKTKGAWDKGYKGQGKVVAVIDTGIDPAHQSMRISDVSTAKVKSKEDMLARQKAAGINYGSWINDKVVFAHNYVENSDNIKENQFEDFDEDWENFEFDAEAEPKAIKKHKIYRPQSTQAPKETVIKTEETDGSHDIDWTQTDDDTKYESHGMHVTGIVAGNSKEAAATGERFLGIAPEAQVMFMRVFANDVMGSAESLFIKAIEDAVALGADVINLSLGTANGAQLSGSKPLMEAIEKAKKAGVSVVVAAGNERVYGSDHDDPLATNPDYGLVGSPSTGRTPTSVAAINSKWVIQRLMTVKELENRADLNHGKAIYSESVDFKNIKDSLGYDKSHQFAYVKESTDAGYNAQDVKGKIALIERDPNKTYDEMIALAKKHGALGVLIFNNKPGQSNRSMRLTANGMGIPSAFISHEFGKAMSQLNTNGTGSLEFDSVVSKAPSQKGNEMNHFSNWGLTSDGYLKPDITAPGGDIYSTYNDNHYGSQTGTSMASPQIAGASLLVKQYLEKTQPNLPKEKIADIVKNLLMSNAQIHVNPETKTTTSPRQQGAGLLNIDGAVTSGLYVTGKDNYGSISLGNITDTMTFDVTVHNLSNKAKTLRYDTELLTDHVDPQKGRFTLTSRSLKTYQGGEVTVPANGKVTVRVTMDVSQFTKELTKQMPNGYYLEGFVRFRDSQDDQLNRVNIPFVGFKGQFENLAVAEESIYRLKSQGKTGFYFDESGPKDDIYVGKHFTGLVTLGSETNVSTKTISDNGLHTLGTFKNADGKFILEKNAQGNPVLAISPNGDNNQDFAAFKGVFLRKYQGLKASVYHASDKEHKNPLWVSPESFKGDKNFNSDIRFAKSTTLLGTAFSGKSLTGAELPDGYYHYVVSYYPDVVGAKRQEMTFDMILDRQKPVLSQATFDPETNRFKPEPLKDRGLAGVRKDSVFYLERKDNKPYTVTINDSYKYVSVADNKTFVERQADGSFILPLDKAKLGDFYYMVEDFAGNVAIAKLGDHLPQTLGKTPIKLKLTDGNYQTKETLKDNLEMTQSDTGLVTNQAQLAVVHRNQPQSQLTKMNQDFFISPNEDGNKDFVAFKGLKNNVYNDLTVNVYAKDDHQKQTPIWSSQAGAGASAIESTAWYGITARGSKVMPGDYQYVVTYRDEHGKEHQKQYTISVNDKKPMITQGRFDTINGVDHFTPDKTKSLGSSGIVREEVFYLAKKNGRKFDVTEGKDGITVSDNKVYIPKNPDGSYTISKRDGVTLSDYYYLVEDRAGNVSFATLRDLKAVGKDKAVVNFGLDLPVPEDKQIVNFTYLVRDADGKPIENLEYYNNSGNSLILPYGKYTVELLTYDTNAAKLESDKIVSFTLSADNNFQQVTFKMTMLATSQITAHFDHLLPEGSRVSLKTAQGQLIPLEQSLYVPKAYGKTVQEGTYEVVVSLPKGYRIEGNTKVNTLPNEVHELSLRLVKVGDASDSIGDHKVMSKNNSQALTASATPTKTTTSATAKALPSTGEKMGLKLRIVGLVLLGLTCVFSRKKSTKD